MDSSKDVNYLLENNYQEFCGCQHTMVTGCADVLGRYLLKAEVIAKIVNANIVWGINYYLEHKITMLEPII